MFKIAVLFAAFAANNPVPVATVPMIITNEFKTLAECDATRTSESFAKALATMAKDIAEKHDGVTISTDSKCFDFKKKAPVDDGSI